MVIAGNVAARPTIRVVLLVVRHGETAPNVERRLLGRADPPLTATGAAQARALAAALPAPDLVVASPLRRARDTAAAFGAPITVDERWIELDYGEFDGRAPGEVGDEVWERWRADTAFAPPGGESLDQLGGRVHAALGELADVAASGVVVVVTHVSPIKAAIAWALDVPVSISWRMFVDDASANRIDVRDRAPVLRWFNRTFPPTD